VHDVDPSFLRLLEHIGPWIGNLGGVIAGVVAWIVNGMKAEMKQTHEKLEKLAEKIPETYATKTETAVALREVGDRNDRRLSTIESDVKELLKLMLQERKGH
jgi:hypothetical protein